MTTSSQSPRAAENEVATLADRFQQVRRFTEKLSEPLSPEDCVVQSMPDVSPTRWHMAHTTWFFETFVLSHRPSYQVYHPEFCYLFNSYYNAVGEQFPRPRRGLISRPGVEEVRAYRHYVDQQLRTFLADPSFPSGLLPVVELGLHHEQQHQELMLTDIKHVLSCNPMDPVYRADAFPEARDAQPLRWTPFEEGIRWVGHEGGEFAFDNESPRHRVFVESFELANQPVTCGEYLQFIDDGGYRRPELWLSEGWYQVRQENWDAPLYWSRHDGDWHQFTLAGRQKLDASQPACHVSYFEADAFATWAEARLPTEAEWECASAELPTVGHFADQLLAASTAIHPHRNDGAGGGLLQMFGDVWEWTASPYTPYPGYRPASGALGEYNGKFMCNQYVLRGGSCATSQNHIRSTYRNFFPASARWQFSGLRLARSG